MRRFFKKILFILKLWRFIPFMKDFYLSTEVKNSYKIIGTIAILLYLFIPFDLIPDYLGVIGFIDDFIIITFIINRMIAVAPDTLKKKHRL